MPTPGGKPKPGERIRFSRSLPPDWVREWRYGTVLERSAGDLWGVKVRWDNGPTGWLQPAGYYMDKGDLELVGKDK